MQLLNGKDVAAFHRQRIVQQIQEVREKRGIEPELSIVVVGDDAPSAMYAASMQKTARSVGLKALSIAKRQISVKQIFWPHRQAQ